MRKQKLQRFLAIALMFCLLLGVMPGASAARTSTDLELQQSPVSISPVLETADTLLDEPAADETVRVIVRFREAPLTQKGFSTMDVSENQAAMAYSDKLKQEQLTQMAKLSQKLGADLEIRYQFTIGVNGVATTMRYDQVKAVEAMPGVESVYIENLYEPDPAVPDTATAGLMIGSYSAWADGYTGAGSRIGVIDTGLDLDHPSFDEQAFLYGLERSAARFNKSVSDYDLLTQDEVAKVLPST